MFFCIAKPENVQSRRLNQELFFFSIFVVNGSIQLLKLVETIHHLD